MALFPTDANIESFITALHSVEKKENITIAKKIFLILITVIKLVHLFESMEQKK